MSRKSEQGDVMGELKPANLTSILIRKWTLALAHLATSDPKNRTSASKITL